jgi:hypothetical protein
MEIIIGYEYNGRYYKSVIKRSDNSYIRYIKIDDKEVYTNNIKKKSICKKCSKEDTCTWNMSYPNNTITFCEDFKEKNEDIKNRKNH